MTIRKDILVALKAQIESAAPSLKTVNILNPKSNITDYSDYQLPAVQIIDTTNIFQMESRRSQTTWNLAVEICGRQTKDTTFTQLDLLDLQETVMNAIFSKQKLVTAMIGVYPIDGVTDLHLLEPNYISTLGIAIRFNEPIVGPC